MDEARAREILQTAICDDESLGSGEFDGYLSWDGDNEDVCLDGHFTLDQLEAIAWWMRNKKIDA